MVQAAVPAVIIDKQAFEVDPKTFSSGSHGWYGRGNLTIGGTRYIVMLTTTDGKKGG